MEHEPCSYWQGRRIRFLGFMKPRALMVWSPWTIIGMKKWRFLDRVSLQLHHQLSSYNIWALLHWGCTPINIRLRVTSYLEKYEKHWTWISIYVTPPTTEILMTHWLTVHVTHPWSSRWAVQKDFLSPSRCKLPLPLLFKNKQTNKKTKNTKLCTWEQRRQVSGDSDAEDKNPQGRA